MKTKGVPEGHGLAQTLLLNGCDSRKVHVGQIVSLAPASPFGTSQTPDTGVWAIRERG